jgi:hypothetical protein
MSVWRFGFLGLFNSHQQWRLLSVDLKDDYEMGVVIGCQDLMMEALSISEMAANF